MQSIQDGFELIPLPEMDKQRIAQNLSEGRNAKFMGDSKLYVGNIAFSAREDDLFQLFSTVGEVGDVALVRDEAGKNRGFGFVTMRTKADGEAAMAKLNGADIHGRSIAVRESNS